MQFSQRTIERWRCAWLVVSLWCATLPVIAATPARLEVVVDDHPFAVWHQPTTTPAAPALLLVHGRTWSSRPDFALEIPGESLSLMSGLNAHGIDTYAVDMRGYGKTPRDASGWLTPDRAAADLIGVLNWLNARRAAAGLPPAHLFGWSYGAMMAQLATQRGAAPASLTLFGYPARSGSATTPPDTPSVAPAHPNTAANAASDFITPNTISQRAIDGFVAAALAADPVRVDWRALEQWRSLDGAAVSAPTLLLQAEHDPYTRTERHQLLFASLASTHKLWLLIPGGDHAAFMETPRPAFIAAVADFIRRHDGGATTR